MKYQSMLLAALLAVGTGVVTPLATAETPMKPMTEHVGMQAATTVMTDGEVRKVDKDAKKITIKHGEIKNLGMPAMTMVFQVKDAALLDKVKVGDKVAFTAQKAPNGYAVSAIEAIK